MNAHEQERIFRTAIEQLKAERHEQRRLDRERAWQASVRLAIVDERAA